LTDPSLSILPMYSPFPIKGTTPTVDPVKTIKIFIQIYFFFF